MGWEQSQSRLGDESALLRSANLSFAESKGYQVPLSEDFNGDTEGFWHVLKVQWFYSSGHGKKWKKTFLGHVKKNDF